MSQRVSVRREGRPGGGVVRLLLSPLDEACLLLDSPAEPWTVHLEIGIPGHLEQDRLRAAVHVALTLHPMGRARLAPGGDAWAVPARIEADPVLIADCREAGALDSARAELLSTPILLDRSPPLRVLLARHPAGDRLVLSAHHAALDAIGSLRILRSIARAYAGHPDPLPGFDPLAVRAAPTLARPAGRGPARLRSSMAEVREILARPVHPAAEPDAGGGGYGLVHSALSAEETLTLTGARPSGVTVNDLLLAALHLALDRWNAAKGTPPGRIRVMMPVNLRPRDWWWEVAGNLTSMVTVATRPRERLHPGAAVAAVRRRTRRLKEREAAAATVAVLARLQFLPPRVKRRIALVLAGERLSPTAVLSNLGRLDDPLSFGPEVGDAAGLWFSPPARMPLGISIGAATMDGRLHLSYRYRLALLGPDAAARFAEQYRSALVSVAEGAARR